MNYDSRSTWDSVWTRVRFPPGPYDRIKMSPAYDIILYRNMFCVVYRKKDSVSCPFLCYRKVVLNEKDLFEARA